MKRSKNVLLGLLLGSLLLAGCAARRLGGNVPDTPAGRINQAANYGQAATRTVEQLQELTIQLNQQGFVGDDATAEIIRQILLVNNALQVAKNTVSDLQAQLEAGGELSAADELSLRNIFSALRQALQDLNQSGVLRVKNEQAKQQLNALITTLFTIADALYVLAQPPPGFGEPQSSLPGGSVLAFAPLAAAGGLLGIVQLLNGLLALGPFIISVIQIVRDAVENGDESIPTSRFLDAWQAALDRTDARGRDWLRERGYDLPPPKPEPR